MELGVDGAEVAVAHLVPVVAGQLDLGHPRQAELARGDQVVEAAVGPAFQGEELDQLLEGRVLRHPCVHVGHQVGAGDDPDGSHGVLGEVPARAPVVVHQVGDEGGLEPQLQVGHGRVMLPPHHRAEAVDGRDV